jgi:O-antigen/teichoic acid export membrane protein
VETALKPAAESVRSGRARSSARLGAHRAFVDATRAKRRPGASALALTAATAITGASNYVYSLGLTHWLSTREYSIFAAGQAILLVAGTLASAGVPWALARELTIDADVAAQQRATAFAVRANAVLAVMVGIACVAISYSFARDGVPLSVGLASLAIVLGSTCFGFLQGFQAFGALALAIVGEVAIKVGVGVGLVHLGFGASGALVGAAAGGLAVAVYGAIVIRRRLGRLPQVPTIRSWTLWRPTVGMLLVQGVVAVLAAVDLVAVAALSKANNYAASYQVAATIGRVPLYLSVAISTALFPALVSAAKAPEARAAALNLMLRALLPGYFLLAFIPERLLSLVLPPSYEQVYTFLPITAGIGFALAIVNVLTTFFQAQAIFRRCVMALGIGVLVDMTLLVGLGNAHGARGVGIGTLVGVGLVGLALLVLTRRTFGRLPIVPLGAVLRWIAPALVLPFLKAHPVAWLVVAAVVGIDIVLGLQAEPQARIPHLPRHHRRLTLPGATPDQPASDRSLVKEPV